MKKLLFATVACLALVSSAQAQSATSAYTSLDDKHRKVLRTYQTNPEVVLPDFFEAICPGRNGLQLVLEGGDSQQHRSFAAWRCVQGRCAVPR